MNLMGTKKTDGGPPKMERKEYEAELRRLHGELVAMQEWVKDTGAKICIIFEGRDTDTPQRRVEIRSVPEGF